MRNLFLALLLANLGFAAWHHWFADQSATGTVAADGPSGITLVSEVDPTLVRPRVPDDAGAPRDAIDASAGIAQRADEESDAPAVPPPGDAVAEDADSPGQTRDEQISPDLASEPDPVLPAQRCVSVGPFRELAQAAAAASGLRTAGHATSQRVAEGDIWVGYWVYLDGIPTVAEANEVLARVREGGVSDSYVIPGTETGSIVSVGVFSEISRAGRRREELRALGLEPEIADRTQRATVYWVDVNLRPDEPLDFDALQAPGRIIRLEQRACPTD